MSRKYIFPLVVLFLYSASSATAQEEFIVPGKKEKSQKSIALSENKNTDTSAIKMHSPRTAAIRSAILPGLGQIYNKKYWKVPLVYGALGVTGGIFIFNLTSYKDTRFAYSAKYKASLPPPFRDSTDYRKIKPELLPLTLESLRFYRDQYRRDIDYSVLFFLIAWGLNVVDATVDAHLKSFDMSPDLSLKIKPGRSEMAGTNGLSLVLTIGK